MAIPSDLPPISNRALYAYRVFGKWLSFFYFGITTLILLILIFPIMRLTIHPKERFRKYGRRFISASMRVFIRVMSAIGILKFELSIGITGGNSGGNSDGSIRSSYRNLKSKIIAANHPSLLDVIMLLSLFPNADCIVNAYVKRSIAGGVVSQLYIFNSLDFDELSRACTESLAQGNCLIIFPEGTRTPRQGKAIVKKGAARFALASGCGIIPIHIGGTDKYGLGKKDPWTGFNPTEKYVYRIAMKPELDPSRYRELPGPAAVIAMTKDLSANLFPGNQSKLLHAR